jgi:hypothetical protein
LRSQPPSLRELAGESLVADDERELHRFCLCKMFTHLPQALFGHVEIVTDDPLAELKRRLLPLGKMGAPRVRQDICELLRGDTHLHADGVADVHSVRHAVECGDLNVEESAKLSVDLPEPFDGAVEPPNPEHEGKPMRHQSLRESALDRTVAPRS